MRPFPGDARLAHVRSKQAPLCEPYDGKPMSPGAAVAAHLTATGRPAVLVAHSAGKPVHVYAGPLGRDGQPKRRHAPVCGGRHRRLRLVPTTTDRTLCARCDRISLARILAGLLRARTAVDVDRWTLPICLTGHAHRPVRGTELHRYAHHARTRIEQTPGRAAGGGGDHDIAGFKLPGAKPLPQTERDMLAGVTARVEAERDR